VKIGELSERVIEVIYTIAINNLLRISISAILLVKASLTLLFQYQYVSGSKSENMVRCFAFHSISFCLFDLLHGRKCTLIHAWASKRRANF